MLKITIIDYGAGNVRNVYRALSAIGIEALISQNQDDILNSDGVILPGVGAAQDTMQHLAEKGLVNAIKDFVNDGKPFLGICMGLQALFDYSLEGGKQECLGLIPGKIVKFSGDLTVPHMGWNQIKIIKNHSLLKGIDNNSYFYFVHSFYPEPIDNDVVLTTTEYGSDFASIVAKNNIYATQFHPEKSGEIGLLIYKNFIDIVKNSTRSD
ncbi:MAG: imidazole glycerol phosphate synthase subunit HisH [Dehalococcoidia bacterium]|nr:imidazole glycerol phosphate synthase subunit HisH [Dehalococcoidia bacterium]